jgi:hypothetical protein
MTEPVSIESLTGAVEIVPQDLQAIATAIDRAAQVRDGDSVALLALLRLLEQRHREICETQFRDALPNNRHTLYTLLRDIEVHGGWPYIQRMKLRSLLANYPGLDASTETEAIPWVEREGAGPSSLDREDANPDEFQ